MPTKPPYIVNKDTGCWEWQGRIGNHGYGCFGKHALAHRFVLEAKLGRSLKEGMVAMHSCDNRACVNPAHLSEGTYLDNTIDMVNKDRNKSPTKSGVIVDREMVKAIKHDLNDPGFKRGMGRALAKKYNINESTISKIKVGSHWSSIEEES